MAKVKTLILDLGNVLLFHDNALLFRKLGERAGLPAAEVERRILSPSWDDANRGLLDEAGVRCATAEALGVDLAEDEFVELFNCHFSPNRPMLEAVAGLIGKYKLALLSNTNAAHVSWFLPRLPLLKRFDAVLLSCVERRVKPEAEFYQRALDATSSRPDEAAFFDDLQAYVDAACALGIHGRLFRDVAQFQRDLARLP